MIMALCALKSHAEEQLRGRLGASRRITNSAIKICCWIHVCAPPSRNDLAHKLIERLVIRDGLANPMLKDLNAFSIQRLLFVPEEVGPFQRPKIGVLASLQQPRYQGATFVAAFVIRECL